jgi:hypothetical protein
MTDFEIFFSEGVKHITDLDGIDHILFIAALTIRFLLNDWKKLLILITAFTIGHSITLALSSFEIVQFPRAITEFLIALTILITAVVNMIKTNDRSPSSRKLMYVMALFFGLIHGLGFSSYLRSMFGKDESIIVQLLSFNLGIEVGQLLIVGILLLISYIFVRLLKISQRDYVLVASGAVAALALQMCLERFPYKSVNNEKTAFHTNHGRYIDAIDGAKYPEQPGIKPWQQI